MNILIAEDDRSFRKGLAYGLNDFGYYITEACDGKEAIGLITKYRFDLVICDLIMPEADGLEVYKIVNKFYPKTKFILLTAYVESDKAKAAQFLLKENFLEKSVGYEVLFEKINLLLEVD